MGSIKDGNVMCIICDTWSISIVILWRIVLECQMAEFLNSSNDSSKNALKKASSDTRDKNIPKKHRREDQPYQILPVAHNQLQEFIAGASSVDANEGGRIGNHPNVERSPKEKSPKVLQKFDLNSTFPSLNETYLKAAHKLGLKSSLPDLNETAPLDQLPILPDLNIPREHISILPDLNETAPAEQVPVIDVWGSNVQNDSSVMTEDLEEVVKIIRKLEVEGYIFANFRLKFLTWYSLYALAKEQDVVRTFVRTLNDDPSCLAEQLIHSFSTIINTSL